MRSPGTSAACRSWSSCTVHSTSASPPGPSLVCRCGSAPRGSRSASTRALIRRISRHSASARPPSRYLIGSTSVRNAAPSASVAGNRVGPQQRLALPDERPAVVVGGVRRQGAHQRPLTALGPQVGVHRQGRVRGGHREQPAQLLHGGVRGLRGVLLVGALERVVDEEHVGVAGVAELATAEPAHGDDGEPGRQRPSREVSDRPDRGIQRGLHGGGGDIGERLLDLLDGRQGRAGRPRRPGRAPDVGRRGPSRRRRPGRRGDRAPRSARCRGRPGCGAPARRRPRAAAPPRARGPAGRRRTGCSPAAAPADGPRCPRRAAAGGTRAWCRARR